MRLALAILLLSSISVATPIETYHQAADGDDWVIAFERAQKDCRKPDVVGCSVELGARTYFVSRAIDVCTPMAIVGIGAGFSRTSSQILTVRTTAIRTWSKQETCPLGIPDHGTLRLENVNLVNYRQSLDGGAPFYGIDIKTRISVSDVGISGFVQGIHMVCMTGTSGCNESTFRSVDVLNSEHSGVYVQGDQANASLFERVRADSNCRYPDRWIADAIAPRCGAPSTHPICTNQHYQCAGFQDLSFIGNTYVGCAAASETTALAPIVRYAGFVFAGPGQQSTGVGLYAEGDTAPNYADRNCNVFGGPSANFAGGLGQMHGPTMTALSVVNDADQGNNVRVDFGRAVNLGGTALAITSAAVSSVWPWRMKVDATTRQLFIDVANTRWLTSWPHLTGNVSVPDAINVGKTVCSPKTGCVASP